MISSVRGPVLSIGLDHAVVEVGGLGFAVQAAPGTLAMLRRGEEARLATALVVREDSLTLYGFPDADTRELFGLLQTVTGVGPRLALAILAVLEPRELCRALADGDTAALKRVPGVGLKSAERLVLELKDKVAAPFGATDNATTVRAPASGRDTVVEALVGLGFAVKQAEQAVDSVLAGDGGSANGAASKTDTSATLRAALAILGRSR
ncbi:MAG TPA: Holliday junction branch migration protein RuvA [Pseudonocardia sp.]|nr:Holliday junction branch migration protein RuvA [Pseudonocardia sp.]